jgi:hypothetical protein
VFPKLIQLLIVLPLSANSLWSETPDLIKQTQLLEAELALAQKPQTYFTFQVRDKKISLKARGIVLKEWEMKKVRYFGNSPPAKPILLLKKSALFPPKRKNIKPGSVTEGGELKLATLELNDMPSVYTLSLEGGIYIFIRPQLRRFFSRLLSVWYYFNWMTFLPLEKIWFSIKKKPLTTIEIVLKNKKDSKELYWAFLEGAGCLIF